MNIDRDEDGVSGQGDEWETPKGESEGGDEDDSKLSFDPECSASLEEIEESGIECEFEVRDGDWWCTTHNCSA